MNPPTSSWKSLFIPILILGGAGIAGLTIQYILLNLLRRWARRTSSILDDSIVKHCQKPLKVVVPLLTIGMALPKAQLPKGLHGVLAHGIELAVIISVAWLLIQATSVLEDVILSHYDVKVRDNLIARKIYTQVNILKKVVTFTILILTLSAVLLSFEQVRQLGISILASAGVLGIIVGFAAQRTIATLLAGIQIAITQPIRLDDVVIVENEWGWIEEITLTYVVVRIWDLRRLVLPITHFIEKPFQNWTRVSADLLGTVYLYTDYTIPVEAVRDELELILKNSPLWDGKVWNLQVTNATEQTMELRALMSAPDSSTAWDLRCEVREKLIDFIRKNYPHALPKLRAQIEKTPKEERRNSQNIEKNG